jgi:iron complex outermembrane receptor protein
MLLRSLFRPLLALAALLAIASIAVPAVAADVAPPMPPTVLEPVVVTGTREPRALHRVPASLSVVDADAVQLARPTLGLEESLSRVPGVLVQNSGNYAQDFRIQVRGFGTRASFGVREVLVLVDGFPENLPDGQAQLDALELGSIGRIEVLRGPAAALYGNAAGGVLQLFTEPAPDVPGVEATATGGSYGLAKVQAQAGGVTGALAPFVTGSWFQLDGYRRHSRVESGTFLARLEVQPDDESRVTIRLDGVDSPIAEDPGGLTAEQVRQDRRQARDLNLLLDAGESVQQLRGGVSGSTRVSSGTLSGYAFVLYRDFDTRLPVLPELGDGITTFHRLGPGGGLRYAWDGPLAGLPQTLSVGFDAQHQDDDRRRFLNEEGERGAETLHQLERVTAVGVYAREALEVVRDVELSAALRYDAVHFDVDVLFPEDSAASGSRTMDAWSPAGGVLYTPLPWLSVYANVGTAFQVPTTTELANPSGPGFNPDIGPQTSVTYEIGGRGDWGGRLSLGIAAYRIDIDDELIPFETPAGEIAFRDAGRSRRWGTELEWQAMPRADLTWNGAFTWLAARYVDYDTDAGDFDGNTEPGIPSWQLYQELAWQHASGLRVALEAFVVSDMFVDDANTASSRGYELLNLRASWQGEVGGVQVIPFLGLNNLTGERYNGVVRLNAQGGRYFEPAPEFNLYGGVTIAAAVGR